MSSKAVLFDLLNKMPDSLKNAEFPSLTVPATPSDVPSAIIRGAIAQIETVRWLNTFQGIKLSDYIGYVGSLSPSPQAAVMGYLQSNGVDISGASSLVEAIKLIGENSGGGLQGPNIGNETVITVPIWIAQTGMLSGQSAYLELIKDIFSRSVMTLPKISDDRAQFIKGILGDIVNGVATWYSGKPVIGEIIEFAFGKIWDAAQLLKKLFTNYGVVFDAMIIENTTLASITMTDSAYTIRRQVMFDHYDQTKSVLGMVQQAREDIAAGGDLLPTDWQQWKKDMDDAADALSTWIDTAYAAMEVETEGTSPRSMSRTAEVNTPNPDLPALPRPIPPPPPIPKPPAPPDQISALLAAYFRTDLILKSKGLKHQIQHGRELVQVVADVSEGVDALKYNDEVVDFGTVRLYLKGKIIEY